jgi:hypothetical protein
VGQLSHGESSSTPSSPLHQPPSPSAARSFAPFVETVFDEDDHSPPPATPPNLPPPIDLFPTTESSSSPPVYHHSVSQDSTTTVHIVDDPLQYMDCTPAHSLLQDSDILPVVHAARLNHVSYTNQCDIGSNINVTAQLDLLDEYVPLANSFDLLGADASVDKMICLVYGSYTMVFANGTAEHLKMYYCPQISETLISPQAMCADASITFSGFDIHCQDLNNPYVRFHGPSGLYTADAPLTRSNNLFYFTQLFYTPTAHQLNAILTTEL